MLILIRQELYKLFMRKKTYVVLVGFILLTILLAFGMKRDADYMKLYDTKEYQIENLQNNLDWLEVEKNHIPDDMKNNEAEITKYQEDMDYQINELKEQIKNLESTLGKDIPWQDKLQRDIANQEKIIQENKSTASSGDMANWNMELDQLQYLQNHNIKPQADYEFNAFNFMDNLVGQLGQVFLVIGIAVFAADMISGEWTPPTLKLLLTQPVSRGKVILSKFITTLLSSVGLILVVEIASFFIVGLFFGFGNSQYPSFVGLRYQFDTSVFLDNGSHPFVLINESAQIIPVVQYTLKLLLTQSVFIVAVTSFVFMISSLVKSSMVSMAISVVSLVSGMIIFQIPGIRSIARFVFINYFAIGEVVTGRIASFFNHPGMTEISSIITLLIWTAICYLVAHFTFTKRDLLI
ncbi:MAG: ABC transporter permease subunit [Eubacteriales bacterium]